MADHIELIVEKFPSQQEANALLARLYDVVEPDMVYGEPVTQGEYTVITAREVTMALGVGYGGGGGVSPSGQNGETAESMENEEESGGQSAGYGGGGGGGGTATGRPVAVIEIGPSGVRVEPIVDPTKIAVAMFTTLGTMGVMLLKMVRQARAI